MSQNGQTHFKNFARIYARFLKCVWKFMESFKTLLHKVKFQSCFRVFLRHLKVAWKKRELIFHFVEKSHESVGKNC